MRVCLMVEGQEGVTWDEWVAMAHAAEAAGLEGLFRSDHYTSFHGEPAGALDAWACISALGAITERIRLGTLVSAATFRHPSELARVAVTADHISGGRVEVGVGAGWFEQEHRQNGFPFPPVAERFDMFAEYVEVLVNTWSAQSFDFKGRHFDLEGQRALPPPVQSPHPPLVLGGRGNRRSLGLAARFASEYNSAFLSAEECTELRARLADACLAAGRDPAAVPLSLMTLLAPGETKADAAGRLDRMSARFRGPRRQVPCGTARRAGGRAPAIFRRGGGTGLSPISGQAGSGRDRAVR